MKKKIYTYGYEIKFKTYEDTEDKVYKEIEKFEKELNKELQIERRNKWQTKL